MDTCYKAVLNECIELVVWAAPCINILEIDEIDLHEFDVYRKIFKEKFDAESKSKQEFIKNTFEFARKCVETICKTIAGAFGTKTNTSNLK
jgi:hypothetical protein